MFIGLNQYFIVKHAQMLELIHGTVETIKHLRTTYDLPISINLKIIFQPHRILSYAKPIFCDNRKSIIDPFFEQIHSHIGHHPLYVNILPIKPRPQNETSRNFCCGFTIFISQISLPK
ncbi:hypothetical protein XMV201_001233 [Aliiroseovarius sp. xm-v-201]|nr:hypothetical protein [Aliiroseovarius sp. xm-m-314]NRP43378.1 hypothetical protein [Aliiroseovarius sp. xm-m-378]NRP49477.1 hypothetical protein [Aliiroseovarius sp. xm-m-354]NRP64249.1 hypothetical protein [Aliiroseovarius sp. xm-v-225]NRP79551.1 hypothetical protein [Aliiroseovarius sp. xm-v-209]NRP91310.1 hypothetical protein [Aliiroseovarius sp. xm-a-134]NRQ04231.1 hypothetical protein [Aliiroseovarius sp. xm-m-309]NRQ07435.1 hypothetical protein [Aliiroseovarius sp. xm-v-201]NRQ1067